MKITIDLASGSSEAIIQNGLFPMVGNRSLILTYGVSALSPKDDDNSSIIIRYCDILQRVLNSWNASDRSWSAQFNFSPGSDECNKIWVKLQGPFLENLVKVCGESLRLRVEGEFQSDEDTEKNGFRTQGETQPTPQASTSTEEAFFEDEYVSLGDISDWDYPKISQASLTLAVKLVVEEEFLHEEGIDYGKLRDICKNIQENNIHSDVTLKTLKGSLPAHKCFLAAHSPVLKEILERSNDKEIEIEYSMECVKSLLHYMYTFDIIHEAIKSLKLALQLYEAAHHYQIEYLEQKLAKMFLLRGNFWYDDIDSTLRFFRFACQFKHKPVKGKLLQVLKSKVDQIAGSTVLEGLFAAYPDVAKELFVLAIPT